MSLTAVVAACDTDASGVRALEPLAGVSVLEHQVRRLAAGGAARIVVLLDEWPAALAAAIQRLRADGIAVDVARGIGDVAERLGGEPRLLLLADSCLPDQASIAALAIAEAPMLSVLPDDDGHDAFERIDADHRWAGLALLNGAALVDTAAMVGDWDPVSTLLRRAVQQGADRIAATAPPILTAQPGALADAETRLLAQTRERPRGWAARFIEAPAAEMLLPVLFARGAPPIAPAAVASAGASIGGVLAMAGSPLAGLVCALPSGILLRIAARLALVQARPLPRLRLLHLLRRAGLALGALGIALTLRRSDLQWGWPLLAALLIVALAAARRLRDDSDRHRHHRPSRDRTWLAGITALPWLLLPFALSGHWGMGLAVIAAYAAASAAWLLWHATTMDER